MAESNSSRRRRKTFRAALFLYGIAGPVAGGFAPPSSAACPALTSPLFRRTSDTPRMKGVRSCYNIWMRSLRFYRQRSSTARNMVLRTPESIIEEASTQNLLDDLIDESVRTSSRRPIMMQFDPSSGWIWRRWSGTVFSETWTSCVRNMVLATIVAFVCHSVPGIQREMFSKFDTLWGQLLSVTTFTLTFFLNQSYALWRKCYGYSRRLQGRLNDLGMTLATHAARKPPANPDEPSTYTPESRRLLALSSRYIRVFNLLTYASFTRSHRPMLTPRGMRRLVERGIITPQERQVLVDAQVPATQRHNAVLIWIIRLFVEGRQQGHFVGGAGFEEQFLEKCHVIRAQYGAIGDELTGRMPLAYAHIVQVLVDVVLWLYPIMAYSIGMTPLLGSLGTGFLTMSYQGLFDLAKQFLDPYDNESFGKGEDPLSVDTLIAETNAGSVRWLYGFEQQPYNSQGISDGEVSGFQLPLHGYSVEELVQMEAEKLKKEQEEQEIREREDAERLEREKAEQEEAKRQEAERLEKERAKREEDKAKWEAERIEQEEAERLKQEEAERIEQEQRQEEHAEKVTVVQEMENEEDQVPQEDVMESAGGIVEEKKEDALMETNSGSSDAAEAVSVIGCDSAEDGALESGDTEPEDTEPVHTVTSIEGGLPVTLDEPECEIVDVEDQPVQEVNGDGLEAVLGIEAGEAPEAAINGFAGTKSEVDGALGEQEGNGDDNLDSLDPSLLEVDGGDLEWFDEGGPDGQEYPISQMLGEETRDSEIVDTEEEEEEKEKPAMTYEEYTKKAAEIMERVENELIETEEILRAPPGDQSFDYSNLKETTEEEVKETEAVLNTPPGGADVEISEEDEAAPQTSKPDQ